MLTIIKSRRGKTTITKTVLIALLSTVSGWSNSANASFPGITISGVKSIANGPREELLAILNDMQNEFAAIQGPLEHNDSAKHVKYFSSKITLKSSQSFIQEITENNSARKAMIYFYDYTNSEAMLNSAAYLTPLFEIVNARVQLGMYTGREYTDKNGRGVTEVKDKQGNYIMDITSKSDWGLKIAFYSKNWGTN